MSLAPVRLKLASAPAGERCLLVALEPAMRPDAWLLRLASGSGFNALVRVQVFGPYPQIMAEEEFNGLVQRLRAFGYAEPSSNLWLERLLRPDRRVRARAAAVLGWSGDSRVIPKLLTCAQAATSELPVVLDALARLGAQSALPLARAEAEKKLLSRRRSGVEALRRFGDVQALAAARELGLERLPEELRAVLKTLDEQSADGDSIATLSQALQALEPVKRGLALDQLYEFGTPLCVATSVPLLCQDLGAVHLWRYQKSVLKRTMQRDDVSSFALLALAIERQRIKGPGKRESVKSGLTGATHTVKLFSRPTQSYLLRRCARYLRLLAANQPALYLAAATGLLRAYGPADARPPRKLIPPLGWCALLNQLLYAGGKRLRRSGWGVVARFADKAAAKAAFDDSEVYAAHLYEAAPLSYLRLAGASLPDVQQFAWGGLKRHPGLLVEAVPEDLVVLLELAEPQLVTAAETEVARRLSAGDFDAALLGALLDGGPRAWALAQAQLRRLPLLAGLRPAALLLLLLRQTETGRSAAATAVLEAFAAAQPNARQQLAEYLLRRLAASRDLQRFAGALRVLEGLSVEAATQVELSALLEWIAHGLPPLQALAGHLLAVHPQAAMLGSMQLALLADSPVPAVRAAACAWVQHALPRLLADPWPLLLLAESSYPDNRQSALAILAQLDPAALEFAAVLALCDSNQAAVQHFACDWLRRHLDKIDAPRLLVHLIEHPHPPMRDFALELIEQHLAEGLIALQPLALFVRSALLMTGLPRRSRDRLLRWLERRALSDAGQGAWVVEQLHLVLRSSSQRDFALTAAALSRIQLAWPELRSDWTLVPSC